MTCGELRALLDAYARGSLAPAELAAFEDHLATCAECAAWLDATEPALEGVPTLRRSVEPEADLWPGIQARLAPRAGLGLRRVTLPGWLLAAAALLLIAVSSGITAVLVRAPRPGTASLPLSASTLSPLEAQYASAASELSAELGRARTRLAPATLAIIERNLAVLDSALAETRQALANDPGNAALERLVIATWQQKMDFLRRAAALSGAG